jgi:hypothetical protein
MNDLERELAGLRASNRRWKLAALTLCVLLAVPLLFIPVTLHFRVQQVRMQAEAQRDRAVQAEQAARLQAEQLRYAAAIREAQRQREQTKEPPSVPDEKKD